MQVLHILSTAVNAVMPIVLLIALGYWLRKVGFLSEQFVRTGSKFVFRVCLSCMLFVNVYSIEGFASISWDIVIYVLSITCVLFVLGLVTALLITRIPERRGVILQSVFRSNFAIIGLPLAGALGGDEALEVAAIVSAFALPLFNLFGVIALTLFVREKGADKCRFKRIVLSIVKNPVILGSVLGLVCLAIRELQIRVFGQVVFSVEHDLTFLYTSVKNLSVIASPLALVVLGAQFEFTAVRGMFKEIVIGTVWRVVLAPIIGVGAAIVLSTCTDLLSCGVNEYPTLIALFGAPTAISSAVMAGEMGSDEQLATQLVVWTSLASILTVFVMVCGMMAAGLLSV